MKTILITGTTSGIGHATAQYFYEKGWNVIATMQDTDDTHGFTPSDRLHILALDVTKPAQAADVIATVIAEYGAIDVLVNNAGYGVVGPLELVSPGSLTNQFMTNIVGMMNVTRLVIPGMRKRKAGTIVNVSSMMGRISFPFFSPYNASKWAVEGFSESLQMELRPFGIHVKLVEPGTIKTNFFDNADVAKDEHALYPLWSRAWKNVYTRGTTGADATQVAQVIYRAATSGSARMRYAVDPLSKLLPLLRATSPLRLFQFIIGQTVR